LLPNGKVLVAGGYDYPNFLASAELYDPANGIWTPTGSLNHRGADIGDVATQRRGASPRRCPAPSASAELYDPSTGTWTATGNPAIRTRYHTATLLPYGKVLIAGGVSTGIFAVSRSAELYDPASGTWTSTARLTDGRASTRRRC
jgi:hypothetical protein